MAPESGKSKRDIKSVCRDLPTAPQTKLVFNEPGGYYNLWQWYGPIDKSPGIFYFANALLRDA